MDDFPNMERAVLLGACLLLTMMIIVWVVSVIRRDASLVDRIWGLGFVLAMAGYLGASGTWTSYQATVFALVLVWGTRLSWHIHTRNRGHGEDPRYKAMRQAHDPGFWWKSLFIVYALQTVILFVVSLPLLMIAQKTGAHFSSIGTFGIVVWCVGFYFEAMGDRQLKLFKADPANKGKVLDSGLWALTRHPNYFGDALLWWGFWLMSCSAGFAWLTVLSPALMSFFLRRVSGVTLLEKSMLARRPAYTKYVAETPAFIPRLPLIKKKRSE